MVINCESCMKWHIEQAARAGAMMEEVLEAIEVGIENGGRPGHGLGQVRPGGPGSGFQT